MKKEVRKFLLFILVFFASLGTYSQTNTRCAADEMQAKLVQRNPFFEQQLRRINEIALLNPRAAELHTIPTVVHIMHTGEEYGQGSNISFEQVQSAIDALNEDFRKMVGTNGDGEGVDIELEFCLAARDPEGNPSNGINRVDASIVEDYAENGIEASSGVGADEVTVKSLSVWPREEYLNIWVVSEIEGNDGLQGIQGYAYFPFDSVEDGIVVISKSFGTIGNLNLSNNLNRVLTHELGHYLGLYHTFHLTQNCNGESNCANQGDRICDTPPAPQGGSCSNPGCSGTQLVENYMDYTGQNCKDMFTQGQKDRMRAVLESERSSLLSSLGCAPLSQSDIAITEIISPSGVSCLGNATPEIKITNFGSTAAANIPISYGLENGPQELFVWTQSIAPGSTMTVALPAITVPQGNHTFNAVLQYEDENEENNLGAIQFEMAQFSGLTLDLTLDFFGTHTSWEVVDGNDEVLISSPDYPNGLQGTVMSQSLCIPEGCYTLIFYDVQGDGMTFVAGEYVLTDFEGNELVAVSGDWGAVNATPFCFTAPEDTTPPTTAQFSASNTTVCAGSSVAFVNQSLNGETYQWSFGGGTPSSSTMHSPAPVAFNTPGTYTVSLTSTNSNNSDTYSTTITVAEDLDFEVVTTDATCSNTQDGTATVHLEGDIDYVWSNEMIGNAIQGLAPGYYSVTATSSTGCSGFQNFSIDSPSPIQTEITSISPSCFGQSDGSLSPIVSGGTAPYSTDFTQNGQGVAPSGLAAGNYTYLSTDDNGCQTSGIVSLTAPSALNLNLQVFNIACDAGGAGSAVVNPTGGTGDYAISWSTGATQEVVNDLAAGQYAVDITDDNGCSVSQNFTITETTDLNVYIEAVPETCAGLSDGSLAAVVVGGNGVYSYNWSTGSTDAQISGVSQGDFTLEVTDGNGCSGAAALTLEGTPALELVIFKSDVSCFGYADGTTTASISGGTEPYAISWNNGEETLGLFGLEEGNYFAEASDANGCTVIREISIDQPTVISVFSSLINAESCAGGDGATSIFAMGGSEPYTYEWENGTTGEYLVNSPAGVFDYFLTDANGCETVGTVEIPNDCNDNGNLTQLIDEHCGAFGFALEDMVSCKAVDGATMYKWRFFSYATGEIEEEFTLGNNTGFMLSYVDIMEYGSSYEVSVKSLIAEEWTSYGPGCAVHLTETIPSTKVTDEDCATHDFAISEDLSCDPIAGVDEYIWTFVATEGDFIATASSFIQRLNLSTSIGLVENQTYNVSVHARLGDTYSKPGNICEIFVADISSDIADLEEDNLKFYPNPNSGNEIFMTGTYPFGNDAVIEIELYDTQGKRIESFDFEAHQNGQTKYQFRQKLSRGMYILKYQMAHNTYEEKLIVR